MCALVAWSSWVSRRGGKGEDWREQTDKERKRMKKADSSFCAWDGGDLPMAAGGRMRFDISVPVLKRKDVWMTDMMNGPRWSIASGQ